MTTITAKELTNQVYDTLAGNVGFSEFHVAFDPNTLDRCEVIDSLGEIYLQIGNQVYKLQVSVDDPEHFRED